MTKKVTPVSRCKYWINKFKIPLVCLGGLLMLVLILCLLRGWLRVTVIPKTTGVFYAGGVKSAFDAQTNQLGQPLAQLGFTNIDKRASCSLSFAQSIHTEVDCQYTQQSYTKLPTTASGKTSVQAQAAAIQARLLSQGWRGGSNAVTVTDLINGTAKGIDYSPDAFYEKVIGHNDCVFDVMIAYSNPQPPAIRAMMSCDRTVNVLGAPQDSFYNSSKGHF